MNHKPHHVRPPVLWCRPGAWYRIAVLLGALCAAPLAMAEERSFDVSDFDKLRVAGSPDVILIQGNREGVVLSGAEADLDEIKVYVDDGTLVIRPRKDWRLFSFLDSSRPVVARVQFKQLERIHTAGSNDISAESFQGNRLSVNVDGSSDVDLDNVQLQTFSVNISGAGDLQLAGESKSQAIQINGSGDYSAKNFVSETTSITINGSGDVSVHATERLDIQVNGSGDVSYLGQPQLEQQINGSGDVRALGGSDGGSRRTMMF